MLAILPRYLPKMRIFSFHVINTTLLSGFSCKLRIVEKKIFMFALRNGHGIMHINDFQTFFLIRLWEREIDVFI